MIKHILPATRLLIWTHEINTIKLRVLFVSCVICVPVGYDKLVFNVHNARSVANQIRTIKLHILSVSCSICVPVGYDKLLLNVRNARSVANQIRRHLIILTVQSEAYESFASS